MACALVPEDLFPVLADYGGLVLGMTLGTTCRAVKKLLDERWAVPIPVTVERFLNRTWAQVGKLVAFKVVSIRDIRHLPLWTREIVLNCNEPLDDVAFPRGLKKLVFNDDFHWSLKRVSWPETLEELTFNADCVYDSLKTFPPLLKKLHVSDDYALNIADLKWKLPDSLIELHAERCKWTSLSFELPNQLKDLRIVATLQPAELVLPASLDSLYIRTCHSVDQLQLPVALSMLHLSVGHPFTENFQLPPNLRALTLESHIRSEFSLEGWILPENLQELKFIGAFQVSLLKLKLPCSLKRLSLPERFNQSVKEWKLPAGLVALDFGRHYLHSFKEFSWPSSLRELITARLTVSDIARLPSGLKLLYMNEFNESLADVKLPPHLTDLRFASFDQSMEHVALPDSLQILHLGEAFEQPLSGLRVPKSLRVLQLGRLYNGALSGLQWPSNEELFIGDMEPEFKMPSNCMSLSSWSHSLNDIKFPSTLQSIELIEFNNDIAHAELPCHLLKLDLGVLFNQPVAGLRLPASLLTLRFGNAFNQPIDELKFPLRLQRLIFPRAFNQPVDAVFFPPTLRLLQFGDFFNQRLDVCHLPLNMELVVGASFRQTLRHLALKSLHHYGLVAEESHLPVSVEELWFNPTLNLPTNTVSAQQVMLPNGLKSIVFTGSFNESLSDLKFPDTLQHIAFDDHFDQLVEDIEWPESLLSLAFGSHFNQPIERMRLPPHLESLNLGDQFDQSLARLVCPPSMRWIKLANALSVDTLSALHGRYPRLPILAGQEQVGENAEGGHGDDDEDENKFDDDDDEAEAEADAKHVDGDDKKMQAEANDDSRVTSSKRNLRPRTVVGKRKEPPSDAEDDGEDDDDDDYEPSDD